MFPSVATHSPACPKRHLNTPGLRDHGQLFGLHLAGVRRRGAVGIGLKATLKTRKLLILSNEKNAKNTGFAQLRYTPGTRLRKKKEKGRLSETEALASNFDNRPLNFLLVGAAIK